MAFEDAALDRLQRYKEGADRTLALRRESEDAAGRFVGRLFGGLARVCALARRAGFEAETAVEGGAISLRVAVGEGDEARALFGVVDGAAAEVDEDLMHEELSSYTLDPSGYSGRVLCWCGELGPGPCQTFAVYRDGVWKTKGALVEKARGTLDDPDEVLDGFCLRLFGRLVDVAAPTEHAGRRWSDVPFTAEGFLSGEQPPFGTRWRR